MIKLVEFPELTFATKDAAMKHLKDNQAKIIELKRTAIKDSCGISVHLDLAEKSESMKGMRMKDGYIYPVINTTRIMDSHNDVHVDGIWNRSATEQAGKVYYVTDHVLSVSTVIAFQKDVTPMVKSFSFAELGYNYDGNTQALVFEVKADEIANEAAKRIIEKRIPIEHSVRMQYVTVSLAANYSGDDWEDERENWNKYYSIIANKEEADRVGYFWAVTEAKIVKEGSMVLFGSNSVTPLLQKDIEPDQTTQSKEAAPSTSGKSKLLSNFI